MSNGARDTTINRDCTESRSLTEASTFDALNPPYATIVADPPWDYTTADPVFGPEGFATQSRSSGKWEGNINHAKPLPYSAMALDEIKALPVADLADGDARLFLWTTNRYLGDAFDVIDAWGATYKQALVWHKLDGNLGGSVAPCSAEYLLVAVWGAPPVLNKASSAVISHAQTKKHSKKPAVFLDLVEQVSPGPYVELFSREPRLGWHSWGYGYEVAAPSGSRNPQDNIHQGPPEHDSMSLAEQATYELAPDRTQGGCSCC